MQVCNVVGGLFLCFSILSCGCGCYEEDSPAEGDVNYVTPFNPLRIFMIWLFTKTVLTFKRSEDAAAGLNFPF